MRLFNLGSIRELSPL